MITGKNYIGAAQSATGSKTYKTFDPKLNLETEWTFTEATAEEIDNAVSEASSAFKLYSATSATEKANFLRVIAQEIEALGDTLIQTYMKESGLPEGRAKGERGRTMGQLNAFAALLEEGSWVDATIDTAQPNREPMPKVDLRKMLVPIGPIVVFGSSNFPFAFSTAGGDTASALAAGCPVIVKSHPMHAATGEMVASAVLRAVEKSGMPNGVFSNLNSSGIEVGQQLVMHPKVKGVGFTGSIKGGTALYRLANQRDEPIPVFAEMGSINPVIALPSALTEKGDDWAKNYAGSITLGAGQFCTNPGLILGIKSSSLDNFIKVLGTSIEELEPFCMLHPNIYNGFENGKKELSSQGGVDVVAEYSAEAAPNYAKQKVLTVNGANFLKNTKLHQEVFGPFSVVVRCEDATQLAEIIEKLEGQLTGTILGSKEEISSHSAIVTALQGRVGRIIFNGVPTGVEVCPSMHHGGPFPASTDSRFTSVGTSAIKRWVRPVAFQNWPQEALPAALKNDNPLGINRLVDSKFTYDKI
ncbi:aldehyde dehydrogenase (NADP(+)) [Aurantibacter crassamenti]|uniref:aldehyde dehydrogenase (NADP(+)) n=1 Tax=Aurantibacter crassamenti TaxID=1837375 RepID=UPI00193AC30C|nr:aldehyde dehydrogenase (NADP(+)) [Aurantibacter crassamenti]MBM1106878.1 aldehyde dehydrogenase (NADP(+)) [Aurantibacter crassamenti]